MLSIIFIKINWTMYTVLHFGYFWNSIALYSTQNFIFERMFCFHQAALNPNFTCLWLRSCHATNNNSFFLMRTSSINQYNTICKIYFHVVKHLGKQSANCGQSISCSFSKLGLQTQLAAPIGWRLTDFFVWGTNRITKDSTYPPLWFIVSYV